MSVTRVSMIAALAIGLFGWAQISRATDIIYDDVFDGTAATTLNGRTPNIASGLDGGTAAATWSSATSANIGVPAANTDALWTVSGGTNTGLGTTFANVTGATTINGADDANQIGNASLPFTPQTGFVYDLHMHSNSGTEAPTLTGNWLGLAFAPTALGGHNIWGQALSNDAPTGLIIMKGSGAVQSFLGPGTGGGKISLANGSEATGVYHDVDILLDTSTSPTWTMSWTVDGVTPTNGGPFALTIPTGSNAIGLVTFGSNKLNGSVAEFELSATAVPEPSTLVLAGLGMVGLIGCIRRRK